MEWQDVGTAKQKSIIPIKIKCVRSDPKMLEQNIPIKLKCTSPIYIDTLKNRKQWFRLRKIIIRYRNVGQIDIWFTEIVEK